MGGRSGHHTRELEEINYNIYNFGKYELMCLLRAPDLAGFLFYSLASFFTFQPTMNFHWDLIRIWQSRSSKTEPLGRIGLEVISRCYWGRRKDFMKL